MKIDLVAIRLNFNWWLVVLMGTVMIFPELNLVCLVPAKLHYSGDVEILIFCLVQVFYVLL